jgi:hypothetical protein
MAKFNSTTFGTISGRHGSAVATTSKDGQSILRVYKAPSNPKTEAQVAHRAKFALVNSELSRMSKLFATSFGSSKGTQLAVGLAMRNAVTGSYPNFVVDYSKLTISMGSLQPAQQSSAVLTGATTVKVEWDTPDDTFQGSPQDNVQLVFMNPVTKVGVLKEVAAIRSAGSVEVELPSVWTGAAIHCWIYFTASDGSQTSTSQYVSLIQL